MALLSLSIKRIIFLLIAVLGLVVVFSYSEAAQAIALGPETSINSVEMGPVEMGDDGGTILPLNSFESSQDHNQWSRIEILTISDRQNDRSGAALHEDVVLDLALGDLSLSFVDVVDTRGRISTITILRRNAVVGKELLGEALNWINFNSIWGGGGNAERLLLEAGWADFRLQAIANMSPQVLVWLEGNPWASFFGVLFLSDRIGSSLIGTSSVETWAPKTLNTTKGAGRQSAAGAAVNKPYSAVGRGAYRGGAAYKPMRAITFKEFALKIILKIVQSPIFYIVIVLGILLFGTRQLMRGRRS